MRIKHYLMVGGLGLVAINGVACSNPSTPAGYVGYVTKNPVTQPARFYELQTGPVSTGLGWQLSVINVSITPYNIDENFTGDQTVLSKDNLKISFSAHLIFEVKPESVRDLIEKYNNGPSGNDDYVIPAYRAFVQQEFRKIAREQIKKYNGLDIDIDQASSDITKEITAYTQNTPFKVLNSVVGNIQYPSAVADAVSQKLATTQILARKQTEVDIAAMEAKKRVAEAHGIADAMAVINNQLTPMYLQHEAIEAQKAMVGSPNHTTVYIPSGPMGLPLVGTLSNKEKE